MSYIISGLNIKNISEYDPLLSYSKYDIVDFQLNNGISVYPGYEGFGIKPAAWFNNDYLSSFNLDSNFNVTGWLNLVSGSGSLYQSDTDNSRKPYVDFNEQYIKLNGKQFLTGTGFKASNQTIMMVVEWENNNPLTPYKNQYIFRMSKDNVLNDVDNQGLIAFSGLNNDTNYICIDGTGIPVVSDVVNKKNIITVTRNSSDSLCVRQNGYVITGSRTPNRLGWQSGMVILGDDQNTIKNAIKYYELIYFTGVLNETQLDYYEKYLYEKYFDNTRLYFAKDDVPVGENYSPISNTGQNYWTQDIDDIFTLSYGSSVNFSAKLSALQFGDGYRSNTVNNINPLNISLSLNYDGLTDSQAKCLIAYFENTPETSNKSNYESFKGVTMDLFTPYKKDAEVYFKTIQHSTPYKNINNIKIQAESLRDSILDYKGVLVQLDENYIKTYPKSSYFKSITYNDVFYYENNNFSLRGYYFYTGSNYNSIGSSGPSGPSGPQEIFITPDNSPTGANSYFTKDFYFKGDIDYGFDSSLRLVKNDLKNSTIEYEKDGINYNTLEFSVNFKKRSTREARAILKFLDDKAGYKIFKYTLPQPYNKQINVYCPEWNHTYNFYDNHDISVKFIEFKNTFSQI